jgi:hypothetical protein
MKRLLAEFAIAAVVGWCGMALPVLLAEHTHYSAACLPVMRDVMEGIKPASIALLFTVAALLGLFARAPTWILGPATVLAFPTWSACDMAMGGDHNLFPIEWAIYGFYAVLATVGAFVGRAIRRFSVRVPAHKPRG